MSTLLYRFCYVTRSKSMWLLTGAVSQNQVRPKVNQPVHFINLRMSKVTKRLQRVWVCRWHVWPYLTSWLYQMGQELWGGLKCLHQSAPVSSLISPAFNSNLTKKEQIENRERPRNIRVRRTRQKKRWDDENDIKRNCVVIRARRTWLKLRFRW